MKGKYDAMQILVQRFDEGREDAIDPTQGDPDGPS